MSKLSLSVATQNIEKNFSAKGPGEREIRLMLEFWRSEVAIVLWQPGCVPRGGTSGPWKFSLSLEDRIPLIFLGQVRDLARAQL